jgi:hypothetical protein
MYRTSIYVVLAKLFLVPFVLSLSLNVYGSAEAQQPIVRYYLERSSSYSIDYHQAARKACRVDFEPEAEFKKNQDRLKRTDEIRNWCSNDKVFYKFKRLNISDCQWENLVPESPIKSLGPLVENIKRALSISNLEVIFKNKLMMCRGDLIIPGSPKSVRIEGLCAPFEASNIQSQGLDEYKSNLLLGVFKTKERSNILQKSIDSSLIIDKEKISLSMNIAIPLPRKISQDISYLLSAQGQKKCEGDKAHR